MSVTVYDSRTALLRFVLRVKRFLADRITGVKMPRTRYTYKGRHHQRHDVQQYRHVPGTDKTETTSYYLPPTIRQRIKAARKNRVFAPVARGWNDPTGAFSTIEVENLLHDKTAIVPAYREITESLQRTRNNAELIRSGAEGPLAP